MWLALLLSLVALLFFLSPPRPIVGAFYVPGYPLVGNACQVLHNPSRVFLSWAQTCGHALFVIHLGRAPVLVVNSHADVHDLWLLHSSALGSRPTLHTFHNVVSAVHGLTVGSTPAGAECIAQLLSQPAETSLLLATQYFVLSAAIRLTYGIVLDCHGRDASLANTIIATENKIIRMRSLVANYQDYIPGLQSFPLRCMFDARAAKWRQQRDAYMHSLYQSLLVQLHGGSFLANQSMLANILRAKASPMTLSESELQSICLTMVSAGLDNSALTFDHLMGHFSHDYGQDMQERLWKELMLQSNGSLATAWDAATYGTCGYAMALLHEALRFFSVLPLGLPRQTTKPVRFRGLYIPANTIVVMNNYAANHDPAAFESPFEFSPDRWLDPNGNLITPNHFSFGAGSRKCAGSHLALKELHTLLCRVVLLFRIKPPQDNRFKMCLDPFEGNSCPTGTSFEPKEFRVRLEPREGKECDELRDRLRDYRIPQERAK
ncbi:hypothetical protein E0198_004497 [Clavispora lusitaniae]|nr:hypothetical protein E0198_004497 [Clavispora lusitaniae]